MPKRTQRQPIGHQRALHAVDQQTKANKGAQAAQFSPSPNNTTVSPTFHAANSRVTQTTYNYTRIYGTGTTAGAVGSDRYGNNPNAKASRAETGKFYNAGSLRKRRSSDSDARAESVSEELYRLRSSPRQDPWWRTANVNTSGRADSIASTASTASTSHSSSDSHNHGLKSSQHIVRPASTTSGSTKRGIAKLTGSTADYAKRKNLDAFFPKGRKEKFFKDLAKKAVALENDPSTDLGKPENIERLTALSLYDVVLYLDDSQSMHKTDPGQSMSRYQLQGEIAKRIAAIANKIVPDELAGVELRFTDSDYTGRHGAETIADAVKDHFETGWTLVGTNLRTTVLKPIVYDKIAQKSGTNRIPLRRPVLVCIITDGEPSNEDTQEMRNEMLRCKDHLREADFEDDTVTFCVCQIGRVTEATKFLDSLRNDASTAQTVYCSADCLDVMFQELKGDEKRLEVRLLRLLTKGLVKRRETWK